MKTASEIEKLIAGWKAQGITVSEMCVKLANACLGWAYVFGARGDYCEPVNRRNRYSSDHPAIKSQCQNFYGKDSEQCDGCKWYPGGLTRCFDCRGFTYWVILKVTGIKIIGAGATSQYNDDCNWSEKGELSKMPNVVCCVFKYSTKSGKMEHTGLHIGNGKIIHCSDGVQTGKTTDRGWTHYAIPKALSDQSAIPVNVPCLKKGCKGDKVVEIQKALLTLGYDLPKYGADGDFGSETLAAVKAFQQDNGLTVNGVVDTETLTMLQKLTEEKPSYTYLVTIPNLTEEAAAELVKKYPNAVSEKCIG